MTKRYFKATDGKFTIFRASESRTYKHGWINIQQRHRRAADGSWERFGEPMPLDLGFSNSTYSPPGVSGPHPAVEIGKGEYQALVAIKTARVEAWRAEQKAKGQTLLGSIGPSDSWVGNDELPEAQTEVAPEHEHAADCPHNDGFGCECNKELGQ